MDYLVENMQMSFAISPTCFGKCGNVCVALCDTLCGGNCTHFCALKCHCLTIIGDSAYSMIQ